MSGLEEQANIPDDLGGGLTTRLKPRVYRADVPSWEVLQDGAAIGTLTLCRIGRSSTIFYRASARLPGTTEEACIELSPDAAERSRAIIAFRSDPAASAHLHPMHHWRRDNPRLPE